MTVLFSLVQQCQRKNPNDTRRSVQEKERHKRRGRGTTYKDGANQTSNNSYDIQHNGDRSELVQKIKGGSLS